MNRRSEAGENDAFGGGAGEFFDARNDGALRRSDAGALDVGRIGKQRENTFVAVASEGVDVETGAADRSVIDLEIAGVNDDAHRSANGERNAIDSAVRYRNHFDFKWTDFDAAAGDDFAESGGIEKACFGDAFFDQRQGKTGAVDGNVQVAKNVRKRADMIFVAVGEHDGANVLAVLL